MAMVSSISEETACVNNHTTGVPEKVTRIRDKACQRGLVSDPPPSALSFSWAFRAIRVLCLGIKSAMYRIFQSLEGKKKQKLQNVTSIFGTSKKILY